MKLDSILLLKSPFALPLKADLLMLSIGYKK